MEDTYAIRENLIEFSKGLGSIPCRFPWGIDSEMAHALSAHDPVTPEVLSIRYQPSVREGVILDASEDVVWDTIHASLLCCLRWARRRRGL